MKESNFNYISKFLRLLYSKAPLEPGEESRRQIFVIFNLLVIIPLLVFGSIQLAHGNILYSTVDLLLACFLSFLILSLRYTKNSIWNFRTATFCAVALFSFWIFEGAEKGSAAVWCIGFPPFAFFLLGKKEGFLWTVSMLVIALILLYNPFNLTLPHHYNLSLALRITATYLIVFLFTWNYEAVRIKFIAAIAEKQIKLLNEKEQLQSEMANRQKAENEILQHHNRLEEIVNARTMEIRKKNHQLEESEKRYRMLADNVTDLIWTMDMNLQFTYISPAITRLYGYSVEEAMVLPIEKWNTPQAFAKVMEAWLESIKLEDDPDSDPDRTIVLELEQLRKDGTHFWTELKVTFLRDDEGKPAGVIGVTRDVTERRNTRELLIQTEKMMTVGGLAAGMAHELNNPLSIIMNSAQNLQRRISPELKENLEEAKKTGITIEALSEYFRNRKISEYISYIHDASQRASDIIRDMLMFSRKSSMTYESADINELIEVAIELYSKDYDLAEKYDFKQISIQRKFDTSLPPVTCVITQIEQVFLNVLKNAAIALTSMDEPVEKPLISISTRRDDNDIVVTIKDNGPGISQDILEHIFDPFYTTREPGKGTGLGLSVSYYIIASNHNGTISASSWPGKGTTLTIRFPV